MKTSIGKYSTRKLDEKELLKSLYTAALACLLIPPAVGGTLMAIMGFFPFPEFACIFTSYTGLYVLLVSIVVLKQVPRIYNAIVEMARLPDDIKKDVTNQQLGRVPTWLFGFQFIYNMLGILSAEVSLAALDIVQYSQQESLFHQFGMIPVVLVSTFPVYFYLTDKIAKYLAPRGIVTNLFSLKSKLVILGIATPLLIDSLLVLYFYNHTQYFGLDTFFLFTLLLVLAIGGTWMAWNSIRQGLFPLSRYELAADRHSPKFRNLTPLSMDEFSVLTARINELTTSLMEQEGLSQSILDTVPVAVLMMEKSGRIRYINSWLENVSGYTREEVVGNNWFDIFVPEENRDLSRERFRNSLPGRLVHRYTSPIVSRNGQRLLIEWQGSPVFDKNDELQYLLAAGLDVTGRKETETLVEKGREKYRALVESLPIGVLEYDLEGTITYSNPAHAQMLGYKPGAPIGKKIWDFQREEDKESIKQMFRDTVREFPEPSRFESVMFAVDGRAVQVEVDWSYSFNESGDVLGMRALVKDVTASKEAELKARLMETQLAEARMQAKVGSWVLDLESNHLLWSKEIFDIFEHDPEKFDASYDAFLNAIHPDDRTKVDEAYNKSLKDRQPYKIEHRFADE